MVFNPLVLTDIANWKDPSWKWWENSLFLWPFGQIRICHSSELCKAIKGDDSPNPNHHLWWGRSEVVIIYPDGKDPTKIDGFWEIKNHDFHEASRVCQSKWDNLLGATYDEHQKTVFDIALASSFFCSPLVRSISFKSRSSGDIPIFQSWWVVPLW